MSVQALTWAFSQDIKRASVKLVLVALANCASEHGLSFPSTKYICLQTSLDRKTVVLALAKLISGRFMIDSGERRGRTGQVKVYRLLCSLKRTEIGTVEKIDSSSDEQNEGVAKGQKSNSTENGTVPKTDGKSPVFPNKESRFSQVRVPKTGHGSVRDPSDDPSGNHTGLLTQPAWRRDAKFMEIHDAYPIRHGTQRWPEAFGHYRARIREGVPHETMLAGVKRYAECMRLDDKLGTGKVQQAATFLGTNRCFEDAWDAEETDDQTGHLKWRPGENSHV